MKRVAYNFIKRLVRFAFYCYYQRIKMVDKQKVPGKEAVMFLPNHQNGLMDPLLIAGFSNRKPYFLTRSDVFVNSTLNNFFNFLRMIPVYRIRDGRQTVHKNEAIFEHSANLLLKGEAILIFPEGNHQIRKFVRPLSKGFTRILRAALDKDPNLNIYLVPVGINYDWSEGFPDRTKFIFDDPISLKALVSNKEWNSAIPEIKEAIYKRLVKLTTHIEPEEQYDAILEYLLKQEADFQNPYMVNEMIRNYHRGVQADHPKRMKWHLKIVDGIFFLVNLPVMLLWKFYFRKRIKEVEFFSTFRFAYAFGAFPLYLLVLFLVLLSQGLLVAISIPLVVFFHNLLYVKLR